jgi:L-threonylcarbamoyladenylate synthase
MIDRKRAADLLLNGNVVIVPTETVYGLAGCATQDSAVRQIFTTKERPFDKPLIVHYGTRLLWKRDTIWTIDAERIASVFWPGPLTLILRRNPRSPLSFLVSRTTIAIRRTTHPDTTWLCDKCGPLAAPSANKYQRLSATTIRDAGDALPDVPILDTTSPVLNVGIESTILDLTTKPYLVRRAGCITPEELSQVVDCQYATASPDLSIPGSGKHYQPRKPVRLNAISIDPGEGLLSFGKPDLDARWHYNLSPIGDLQEAAKNLYKMLWELDRTDCSRIAIVPIPDCGVGVALNEKLQRATLE